MTAEEELNRIENRKLGLDGYTFKEMVWFAEYYAKKQVEQLTIHGVRGMFSEQHLIQAYNDGREAEQQRCDNFDIENYS